MMPTSLSRRLRLEVVAGWQLRPMRRLQLLPILFQIAKEKIRACSALTVLFKLLLLLTPPQQDVAKITTT